MVGSPAIVQYFCEANALHAMSSVRGRISHYFFLHLFHEDGILQTIYAHCLTSAPKQNSSENMKQKL